MRFDTVVLLVLMSFLLTGCQAIASIFEAGVWVGVILVLVVLGLIGFLFSRLGGRR
jgi:Flp pilus assembly protein protease CpaA